MPINLDALIRYHTIDHCLQRKFKEWTISSLGLACFDAIEQVKPIKGKSTISKRTIEDDIRIMRSEILGYNAPIEIKNSIVRYTDKNYSIKNCSLNKDDLENLTLIAQVLRMYNGFKLNTHIDNILKKLETQSYLSHFKEIDNIVQIESPPITQGFEYLYFILKSILEKQVIKIEYKKFQSNISETHVIHPYLSSFTTLLGKIDFFCTQI
jgi:predicted DNA-binding transcriptional regulator YafY